MEKYEITYLVADESVLAGKPVEKAIEKAEGKIVSAKVWGQKELAYPIGKVKSAFYATIVAELDGAAIAGLDRALRLNPLVIRALIVKGVYEPKPIVEYRPVKRETLEPKGAVAISEIKVAAKPEAERKEIKVTPEKPVKTAEKAVASLEKVTARKPAAKPAKKAEGISDEERLAQLEGKLKELLKE